MYKGMVNFLHAEKVCLMKSLQMCTVFTFVNKNVKCKILSKTIY